jgi:hypothetical protein
VSRNRQKPKPPERVAGVSHALGGPGPTILERSTGKTWRLGFDNPNAQARLEELVRGHVLREGLRNQAALGGAEGRAAYDRAEEKLRDGYYWTHAEGWSALLKTPAGGVLYLLALLRRHHPEATEADAIRLLAEEPQQAHAALDAISPSFWAALTLKPEADAATVAEYVAAVADGIAAARATTAPPSTAAASSGGSASSAASPSA